jgi:hypothetical protein
VTQLFDEQHMIHWGEAMKRFKLVTAVFAAIGTLTALSSVALADDPAGRAAATQGLATAAYKITFTKILVTERPVESISLNIVQSVDPETPGVTPGTGGEPAP